MWSLKELFIKLKTAIKENSKIRDEMIAWDNFGPQKPSFKYEHSCDGMSRLYRRHPLPGVWLPNESWSNSFGAPISTWSNHTDWELIEEVKTNDSGYFTKRLTELEFGKGAQGETKMVTE